ncbi:MAG: hypothetical protein R6V73_01400 [Anaerolineales bacterium]
MTDQLFQVPVTLQPYFQEYDLAALSLRRDANLIIQRTLEYGTWDELRWLFRVYSRRRLGKSILSNNRL